MDGLSRSINLQLDLWHLSAAEKEVAFLLLKGLSLREIAAARHTSEKQRACNPARFTPNPSCRPLGAVGFLPGGPLPPFAAPAVDRSRGSGIS